MFHSKLLNSQRASHITPRHLGFRAPHSSSPRKLQGLQLPFHFSNPSGGCRLSWLGGLGAEGFHLGLKMEDMNGG